MRRGRDAGDGGPVVQKFPAPEGPKVAVRDEVHALGLPVFEGRGGLRIGRRVCGVARPGAAAGEGPGRSDWQTAPWAPPVARGSLIVCVVVCMIMAQTKKSPLERSEGPLERAVLPGAKSAEILVGMSMPRRWGSQRIATEWYSPSRFFRVFARKISVSLNMNKKWAILGGKCLVFARFSANGGLEWRVAPSRRHRSVEVRAAVRSRGVDADRATYAARELSRLPSGDPPPPEILAPFDRLPRLPGPGWTCLTAPPPPPSKPFRARNYSASVAQGGAWRKLGAPRVAGRRAIGHGRWRGPPPSGAADSALWAAQGRQ
ncbi:MAG: hypothetical protein ACI9ZM_003192 [Paracoccaceae bacterium]